MFQDRKQGEFSSRALIVKWAPLDATFLFIDILASLWTQEIVMDFAEAPQGFQTEILNIVLDTFPNCQTSSNLLTLTLYLKE